MNRRAFLLAAAFVCAASCASTSTPAPVLGGKPRLVVLIVVDGLPQRQVVDYRDQLAPDGLERFFTRGTWFSNAHFGHGHTATAPGHATLLTGATPSRTGIIGNEWMDPATGEWVYSAGDSTEIYTSGRKPGPFEGTSPRRLKAESLGDVLRSRDRNTKVVAVSIKDRAAILAAGKTGVAYMYDRDTGGFVTTTFYMRETRPWLREFNARKPADEYFRKEWKALLPDSAYSRSAPDDQKWFARRAKLPMTVGQGEDKPNRKFYTDLVATPFSDDLTLNFARAAIAGENMGRGTATDLLVVSLSGHDYVNHSYGAESRLSHDHVLQIDLLLQSFLLDLDASVGRDNYIAVLTSDHGFTPVPELSASLGRDAGRFNMRAFLAKANAELAKKHGIDKLLRGLSADSVVFDRKLIAEKKIDANQVAEDVRKLFLAEPGALAAYTRSEMEKGSRKGAPLFDQMRKSWDRDQSGDVHLALKPYWIISSGPGAAATHGQPNPLDTHVPLMLYGPAWIGAGRVDTRVDMTDLAPTLAKLVGVPAPAQSEGKVLPMDMRTR